MALNAKTTQDFVPIKEIRNGVIVLKDGGLRAILLASSINLSLKSYDEQQATIMQFQTFLNSLEFPTQIVIQSREYDIRPYLSLLEKRMKEQQEPLLKIQTREYIQFIKEFTEQVDIMSKSFFVVVSFYPSTMSSSSKGGIFGFLKPGSKKGSPQELMDFEEQRTQLDQRVGVVQQGLSRVGVRSAQLGTEEIIELFYKTFNPGDASGSIKVEQ
ncbi:MAG: hypothetical protein WDK96_04090 [Candidatus Paceibacterota bacterium]|jgi:hypothetical protein